ncbi:MAG: hypothetical protein RLZZ47_514 [Bacteroidota bacterium]|jgi:hypothetical protein
MRKHVYYLSALLIALSACGSGSFETEDIEENTATAENPVNKNKGPLGDVLFKDTVFMFGDVKDGESVQHTYTFKNTGVAPISIANVVAQCGCTTPEYTHEVVAPGKSGKVTATFNSSNRGGPGGILNEKSITVTFENSKTTEVVLKFKANVIAPEGSVSEEEMMGGEDGSHSGH